MQSMIASQQQLIRRTINTNNNNDSNDHKNQSSNELNKSVSDSKDNDSNESNNCLTSVPSLVESQSISSTDTNDCNNTSDVRKSSDKTKKRRSTNSWLNILNPTYKTRHEEFKRLFSNLVPNNERLVVDYSCALQKEILVHGRLYLSLNYISFYANIFKWETSLVIKCRDITSLTKANTARVIPNAIQVVTTSGDKYVFTSFGARDKTYVMLFRIWQNALLDQPMSSAQLWQWVHYSYGEDLGLTSDDDEEYYSDQLVQTLSPDNPSTGVENSDSNSSDADLSVDRETYEDCLDSYSIPTDCKCVTHEGKLIMNTTYAVPIDHMFELLFTDNKFIHYLHKMRRTYDLCLTQWDDSMEGKKRQLRYTVALNHALVKSARTIEKQNLLEGSSGDCYVIKSEAHNEGVPYCDTFYTHSVWCLTKESEDMTRIKVHSKLIFKKSVWGLSLMKPMIEKSSIQGITDFCTDFSKQLPNWLKMQHNLGIASHMAINDLPIDLKNGKKLSVDNSDSNYSAVNFLKPNPLVQRPRHRLHPILKSINSLSDSFLIKTILLLLLFTLLINSLILVRIWKNESNVDYSGILPSDQSQTGIHMNNFKDLIQNSIELIKNIEKNLKQLKNKINEEL